MPFSAMKFMYVLSQLDDFYPFFVGVFSGNMSGGVPVNCVYKVRLSFYTLAECIFISARSFQCTLGDISEPIKSIYSESTDKST